ncbi:MAG: hypothetical protein JXR52_05955, partial [Bacteroidales bacterium]|nr:hypothetical protein [Bacteroidales bacterium]
MNYPKNILIIAGACILLSAGTVSQPRLGEWRTHLPYIYSEHVAFAGDRIFCSTTGGLFYYHLEDRSINPLSKVDGLSDNRVSAMNWESGRDLFLIAYSGASIDILHDGGITNIPDIMKKQISGDKTIYDIYFLDNLAYLSTGFGIVVINLDRNEIKDTYVIGDNGNTLVVYQVTSDDQYLYAATGDGVRRARRDDPFLVDYHAWEVLTDLPHDGEAFNCIATFEGTIFTSNRDPAGEQDRVYYLDNGEWKTFPVFTGKKCHEIRPQAGFLLMVDDARVSVINSDLLFVREFWTGEPRSAVLDAEGNIWAGDYGGGLLSSQWGNQEPVIPNGPLSSSVFNLASSGGIIYSVQGGISGSWNNLFKPALLESFSGREWSSSTHFEDRDLLRIAIDPADPAHLHAASWGYGLLEYRDMEHVNTYGETNSSLQSIRPGQDFVRIGGLAYDGRSNLWMTNANVPEPLSVLKADGSWKSFKVDNLLTGFAALGDLIVTQSGHKWVIIPKGNGLFAMDDNGTIDDVSDDTYELVSVIDRNGKVITNEIFSFAEDRNGNIWLGTNRGILVFYSPYRLFTDGTIYAQEIIVPRNDGTIYGDPLLETQKVTAIEVDGANRKWLGTEGGGVFLVSDDG